MLIDYEKYIEQLLQAQHRVSKSIEHKPTQGATREDFFKDQLKNVLPRYRVASGIIVSEDGKQSPQCDCILIDATATCRKLGSQEVVFIEDVKAIVEVKSTIRSEDLKKFNNDLKKISKLAVGTVSFKRILFGFNVDLKPKTFYQRFGYHYNSVAETFEKAQGPKRTRGKRVKKNAKVEYPEIDAIVNLSVESGGTESFFIQRTPNDFDDNDYYFNKCEDNEIAFGQFLKMIK